MIPLTHSEDNKIRLSDHAFFLFAFLGPLSTTFLDKPNLLLVFGLIVSYVLFFFVNKKKLHNSIFNKVFLYPYILYYFVAVASATILSSPNLTESYIVELISRTFTILNGLLIVFFISDWVNRISINKALIFIKFSLGITLIFLFFAYYQVVAFKYGLPFIETRSHVPGADYTMQQLIGQRVTSLAREPNFYSPIIFESLVLAFIILPRLVFNIFLLLTAFILIKTFSTGAYIHCALLLLFFLVQRGNNAKRKIVIATCAVSLLFFIIVLFFSESSLYEYFVMKLDTETSGQSYRTTVISTIISSWLHGDVINILFGYGLSTIYYINDLIPSSSITKFSISNNLFIDFMWDSGVIGTVGLIVGWSLGFIRIWKKRSENVYFRMSLIMLVSFFITSLYRSEYTTTHFFWVISNIIILYYCGVKKGAGK